MQKHPLTKFEQNSQKRLGNYLMHRPISVQNVRHRHFFSLQHLQFVSAGSGKLAFRADSVPKIIINDTINLFL